MKCIVCGTKFKEPKMCKTCLRFLRWKYNGDMEEVFAHMEQIYDGGERMCIRNTLGTEIPEIEEEDEE